MGWLGLLPALAVAAIRIAGVNGGPRTALALALLPLAMLPAYPVLVLAALTRRRALGLAAAVNVAAHLLWLWPALPPADPVPSAARAHTLTLVSLNVGSSGLDIVGLDRLLTREQPDVLALQEVKPAYRTALTQVLHAHGLTAGLLRTDQRHLQGGGLWTRLPVLSAELADYPGARWPRLTVDVAGRPLTVQVVHTWPPHSELHRYWSADLLALARAQRDEPAVLVGDFNAGRDHAPFRELLRSGLRDAMGARGHGHVGTWPADRRLIPPLLELDHVLLPNGVHAIDAYTAPAVGSDHLPLVARLGLN
ncbi:endonuclease/exonuclease/phosphatase family protein [Motilibacter aurantiacus]|uniref:endonuclease/exonuclease/phosphatase family protein n=1 Tax=Motilibacter aurantiacus TaxID=2714955 RepID=UPI001407D508|nr:endonuclease/exonuclease/phosphatase family protein [Motilibacter aurantiacus]NHC47168.1 endonuclease/exonuclease/phosphatase family protein [Motilibacter aurantiacus]